MPKISKFRIVNLVYDHDTRIMPNLKIECTDSNGNATHTLIDLINGGGKTVLIQMLGQIAKPKAKIQQRSISSYLNIRGSHFFVLVEWEKDNNDGFLLTGIAYSASDKRKDGDAVSANNEYVRYYTFLTEYQNESPYSIDNIDLSRVDNGVFHVYPYDTVSSLATKSGGELVYYSANDSKKWIEKINEYGISSFEWSLIMNINSVEATGLQGYLTKMNTSEKILDNFIIPAIDQKIMSDYTENKNGTIETMFLNYVKKLITNDEKIKNHKANTDLLENLTKLTEYNRVLGERFDTLTLNKDKACGLRISLTQEKNGMQEMSVQLEKEINQLDEDIEHIQLEKLSKSYYEAKDVFDEIEEKYNEVKNQLFLAKQELDDAKKLENVINCAKINADIVAEQEKINGYNIQIKHIEEESDIAGEIEKIKYSVEVGVKRDKEEILKVINDVSNEIKKLEDEVSVLTHDIENKEKDKREVTSTKDKIGGALDNSKQTLDAKVVKCGLNIIRYFDGSYKKTEIDDIIEQETKKVNNLRSSISHLKNKLKDLDCQKSEFSEQVFELKENRNALVLQQDDINSQLSLFHEKLKKMIEICGKYECDLSDIYSSYLKTAVNSRLTELNGLIEQHKKLSDEMQSRLNSAKLGHLHILPEIEEYVLNSDVKCQTGENYLCGLYEKGSIDSNVMEGILASYPIFAYSLIFSNDSDIKKFLNTKKEKWLPASIPIFNMEQVNNILNGDVLVDAFLANYDKTYFLDRQNYCKNLEEQIEIYKQKENELAQERSLGYEHLNIISQFEYPFDWEDKKIEELSSLSENMADVDNKLHALQQKITEIEKAKDVADRDIDLNMRRCKSLEKQVDIYREISDLILAESKINEEYQSTYVYLQEICSDINQLVRDKIEKESSLINFRDKQNETKSRLEEIEDVLNRVKGSKMTELVDGTWRQLFERYKNLSDNLSKDINALNEDIDRSQDRINVLNNELSSYELMPDEYLNVIYTPRQLNDARRNRNKAENNVDYYNELCNEISTDYGKYEGQVKFTYHQLQEQGWDEPLSMDEIGDNFRERINEVKKQKKNKSSELKACNKKINDIGNCIGLIKTSLKDYQPTEEIQVELSDNVNLQWENLLTDIIESEKMTNDEKRLFDNFYEKMLASFKDISDPVLIKTLEDMHYNFKGSDITPGSIRYIYSGLTRLCDVINKQNRLTENLMKEVNDDFKYLVEQCVKQGSIVYDDLRAIENSSKVKVYEDDDRKIQMIKIELKERKYFNEEMSRANIEKELNRGAEIIKEILIRNPNTDDIGDKIKKIVGSGNILRKYVDQEHIQIKAYKIDKIRANSRLISWELSVSDKSGGEGFASCFALIAAMINYARRSEGVVDKNSHSVIPLDNPFGQVYDEYLLKPFFRVAEHFNIQLICVSGIKNYDVPACFNVINKLKLAEHSFNSMGILLNNEVEKRQFSGELERGFYKMGKV